MNELALFAGAGGGLLGTRLLGWKTVCYVEKEPYCVQVLKARIKDGYLDDAPIWDDIRTFDGRPWIGLVDVISAGFPCQPFSGAGLQLGERDERNMWPDTIRIITEIRPGWILLENVSRLLSNAYIRRIFSDLAESGYDARWDCIPASAIGAPHQRDRLWIVAYSSNGDGRRSPLQVGRVKSQEEIEINDLASGTQWSVEPELGRVAYGVAHRVDRLATIGNGQVPAVVRAAWMLLGRQTVE